MSKVFDNKIAGGNVFREDDILAVLLALQDKINRELHVASLGVVTGINDANKMLVNVVLFPKAVEKDETIVVAQCIRKKDFEVIENALNDNDNMIACITFVDRNSYANYQTIKSNKSKTVYEDNNLPLHSVTNAIVTYVGDSVKGKEYHEYEE